MTALPYGMFDLERSAADARRFDRVENIYHRGQDLAWSGRDVLATLVEKHGGVHVPVEKQEALRQVFGPVLWGELAAWKISAQLADRLEPLEAKMAATSQAHDEARHFYVMHDYLKLATGSAPRGMHPASERLLGLVLEADDLAQKLMGMQLQVETTALTLFQHAREARICPVLSELLPYFEKDEARHVGLGTQVLPIMMRQMSRLEAAQLTAYALRVTFWLLASNRAMEPGLRTLGLEPRRLLTLAKSKQMIVWQELWQATNKTDTDLGDVIARAMEAIANGMWPPEGEQDLLGRARAVWSGLRGGVEEVPTSITPDA
ncbi:MAG: ferritin-like domain-containing protein [Minicystis sp.]